MKTKSEVQVPFPLPEQVDETSVELTFAAGAQLRSGPHYIEAREFKIGRELARRYNEHAALLAVAEAAENHQASKPGEELKNWARLNVALAALAAVREGVAR